jgi:ABC-type uncharacterized transport system substrate-binding protein
MDVGAWYLSNVRKPDIGNMRHFVQEGMLCAIDDSGYKQGYQAARVAHRILTLGEAPGQIAAYAPEPGPFVVNLERAQMLGLLEAVAGSPLVGDRIERAMALEKADP